MRISDWSSDVCSSDLYARAPIEPCPAGSRPTWFGSMRQGVDNLAFGNDAGVAGVTPLRDFRTQRCKVGQLAIDFRDVDRRDRKSVVEGKSVSVRVDLGGRRIIKKKITQRNNIN